MKYLIFIFWLLFSSYCYGGVILDNMVSSTTSYYNANYAVNAASTKLTDIIKFEVLDDNSAGTVIYFNISSGDGAYIWRYTVYRDSSNNLKIFYRIFDGSSYFNLDVDSTIDASLNTEYLLILKHTVTTNNIKAEFDLNGTTATINTDTTGKTITTILTSSNSSMTYYLNTKTTSIPTCDSGKIKYDFFAVDFDIISDSKLETLLSRVGGSTLFNLSDAPVVYTFAEKNKGEVLTSTMNQIIASPPFGMFRNVSPNTVRYIFSTGCSCTYTKNINHYKKTRRK